VDAPAEVHGYLGDLVARLKDAAGEELIAVYAVGSLALNGYVHGPSDIDVLAVVAASLDAATREKIARRCSHSALPCPARKLELVVTPVAEARSTEHAPRWDLNLNTGAGIEDHVGTDPSAEPEFWFVLDQALANAHAVALTGPPASELIATPTNEAIAHAQAEAIAWFAEHEPGAGAFITAARTWHWHETGSFASKPEALSWAFSRLQS
jgi:hypothetical protein